MKTCEQCKYCVMQDTGYSNYTVEGTDFECRKNVHPDGSFDRFYGEDERLKFAERCPEFSEGSSIKMDVDQDNLSELTPEQLAIFNQE